MGRPPPRSPANLRSRNPAKDIELLSEAYNNHSNCEEESSDLISFAVSTRNALKGSKISANSLADLIETYANQSNCEESASDLCDVTCRTVESLKSSRKSVSESVLLIETYANQSNCEESASDLCNVTCQTIDALKGTGFKVQEHVVPIIESYAGFSDQSTFSESASDLKDAVCATIDALKGKNLEASVIPDIIESYGQISDESLSDLRDVTCRTIESLNLNGRPFNEALSLIRTYADQSEYDESASDLCDATCKSLEYLASHEVKVETFLERIEGVKTAMEKQLFEEYVASIESIKKQHKGISRWYEILKENVKFNLIGNVQSFSAAELCDAVTGEKYATLDKKREREVHEPEKSPEIVEKKDDGKDKDKGKDKGNDKEPIFI
jgi:hypothetical protein